jgi:hypothetical protein
MLYSLLQIPDLNARNMHKDDKRQHPLCGGREKRGCCLYDPEDFLIKT